MSGTTPHRGGGDVALPPDAKTETLGVSFFDLSRTSEWSSSEDDERIASFLQRFYELSAETLEPAAVRIVKFIGDAGLAVFTTDSTESAESAVNALCGLAERARELALSCGIDSYLNVSIHVGPVVTGTFGSPGTARFDVIGKSVNVAARLGRRGVTLSAQAFRCLGPEGRQRFEKISQPTNYRLRR